MKKNTVPMRIRPKELDKIKKFNRALGTTTADTMEKLLNSPKLNLDRRVMEESNKLRRETRKELGI